jgi:metal-responsive CopG/Arc/MetJ family transcriptional regulator
MKKKLFTRPVSVTLSDEMFEQIKAITDHGDIGLSEYIRDAIQEKLARETPKIIQGVEP